MEATATTEEHFRARAQALRQAALADSAPAMTGMEIQADLVLAPQASTVKEKIQVAAVEAAGTAVAAVDMEVPFIVRVAAAVQAGRSLIRV